MKIRIVSDLHLDCGAMRGRPSVGADLAIVAGDTVNGSDALRIPELLESLFPEKRILAIVGNHEGYRLRDFEEMCKAVEAAAKGTRVTMLRRSCAEIDGVAFLGATLWTDFELYGKHRVDDGKSAAQACMMDYRCVGQNGVVITADDTLAWHQRDLAWLRSEFTARRALGQRVVAITHHAPSRASLAKKYAMYLSSAGFVSDLPNSDFEGISAWVHGHTHTSFDHEVEGCRVICNPRGYTKDPDLSTENPAFNPDFTVDI